MTLLDAEVIRPADPENPWPGLGMFTEESEAFFNGRQAEKSELFRLVKRETLSVLTGQSGLGKSSLLRAGVFPLLRADDYLPVYVRLDHSDSAEPRLAQLKRLLLENCTSHRVDAPATTPAESVWEYLHRAGATFWSEKNRVVRPVLVIDQFEEVFTLGQGAAPSGETSDQFIRGLADLAEHRYPAALTQRLDDDPEYATNFSTSEGGFKLVLCLREDFLAELESMKSLMRLQNRFRLVPMRPEQALDAVLKTGGKLVEPDTAAAIVEYLAGAGTKRFGGSGEADVDPALLSIVCTELNEIRKKRGRATIDADLLQGSKDEILANFYNRATSLVDPRVRVFVEDELLTTTGFRNSFAVEDAVQQAGVTRSAIDVLVAQRLLRVEERLRVLRVELAHDVLTGVVKESRDSRQQLEQREAEERARAEREAELERQVIAGQEKARRNRRQTIVFGTLAAAALVLAAVSSWQYRQTTRQQKQITGYQDTLARNNRALLLAKDSAVTARAAAEVALRRAIIQTENARRMRRDLVTGADAFDSSQHQLAQVLDQTRTRADSAGRVADFLQQRVSSTERGLQAIADRASSGGARLAAWRIIVSLDSVLSRQGHHPANESAAILGNYSWQQTLNGDFAGAVSSASDAASRDTATWIRAKLAHALFLSGKADSARRIYTRYHGASIKIGSGPPTTWDALVRRDVDEARSTGVTATHRLSEVLPLTAAGGSRSP